MLDSLKHGRFFVVALTLISLTYLFLMLFYNHLALWSVDDFWFAHRIYQFKEGLPYRDFSPYKTVLGYYVFLPTMLLGHDALTPILYTKQWVAVINTLLFAGSGIWLTRFFPKPAILIALSILMFCNIVLMFSTNIRVDILAYWLCLFSALLLFDKRFFWAGIVLGIAFDTSQKVLWYIAASDVALGVYWLIAERNRKIFLGAVFFNAAILIVIAAYITAWSAIADLKTVLHNMFYDAYIVFQIDTYDSARKYFWEYILTNNPFIFLLSPLFLMTLFVSPPNDTLLKKRLFIAVYTTVIISCLIPYKQVFPYYMLTTLPAFILLFTAFFAWLIDLFKATTPPTLHYIDRAGVWGLLLLYLLALIYINIIFVLPPLFLSLGVIALLLGLKITSAQRSTLLLTAPAFITFITVILAFIYPLIGVIKEWQLHSGTYQRYMTQLTQALLNDGSDYVAGIELIYNKTQPIPGMRHLDAPALAYLYQPTPALAKAMIDSLYSTPNTSITQVIDHFEHSSVKLIVNNYRMNALPIKIKHYLAKHYAHFWGSIYLYAPTIQPAQHTMQIRFNGNYLVASPTLLRIDNTLIKPNSIIQLTRGQHSTQSTTSYRLQLQPDDLHIALDPAYQADNWEKMF